MLTLDTMLSITLEGGEKHICGYNISHQNDQHFIDSISLEISIGRRKRLDGMPKNSLGKGHGIRVGGYNWVSYFGVNILINKTKQFQLFYHKKLMMPVW